MHHTEITSQLIIDLNVSCKTIFLGKKPWENSFDLGLGKAFFYMTLKVTTSIIYYRKKKKDDKLE